MYFDNVGGEHLEAAICAMADFGRVVACGAISSLQRDRAVAGAAEHVPGRDAAAAACAGSSCSTTATWTGEFSAGPALVRRRRLTAPGDDRRRPRRERIDAFLGLHRAPTSARCSSGWGRAVSPRRVDNACVEVTQASSTPAPVRPSPGGRCASRGTRRRARPAPRRSSSARRPKMVPTAPARGRQCPHRVRAQRVSSRSDADARATDASAVRATVGAPSRPSRGLQDRERDQARALRLSS